jgi:hypothetical protein
MNENESLRSKWVPLLEVQIYFNYRPTQMAALLKNKTIKVAKVGKRKFIFRESLNDFLEGSVKD